MAAKIKAINLLRPKLKLLKPVEIETIAAFIEGRTGVTHGAVLHVLHELRATIIHFSKMGTSLNIPGVCRFTPYITSTGVIKTRFKSNKWLNEKLGTHSTYEQEIINKDNIGKTSDDLVAIWNEENPTDPVVETPTP